MGRTYIVDSFPDNGNQLVLIHPIKIRLNVQIYHSVIAFIQVLQYLFHYYMTAPVRPESATVLAEIALVTPAEYLANACWITLSTTVGMPKDRFFSFVFGMYTLRTGCG